MILTDWGNLGIFFTTTFFMWHKNQIITFWITSFLTYLWFAKTGKQLGARDEIFLDRAVPESGAILNLKMNPLLYSLVQKKNENKKYLQHFFTKWTPISQWVNSNWDCWKKKFIHIWKVNLMWPSKAKQVLWNIPFITTNKKCSLLPALLNR